jgi:hypothetical protein
VSRLGQGGDLIVVDGTDATEADVVQLMGHVVLELLAAHFRVEIQEDGGVRGCTPDEAVGHRLDNGIHLRVERSVGRKIGEGLAGVPAEIGFLPAIKGARKRGGARQKIGRENETFEVVVGKGAGGVVETFPDRFLALLETLVGSGGKQYLPLGVGDRLALTAKREDGQHLVGFAGVDGQLNPVNGDGEWEGEGEQKQDHRQPNKHDGLLAR